MDKDDGNGYGSLLSASVHLSQPQWIKKINNNNTKENKIHSAHMAKVRACDV